MLLTQSSPSVCKLDHCSHLKVAGGLVGVVALLLSSVADLGDVERLLGVLALEVVLPLPKLSAFLSFYLSNRDEYQTQIKIFDSKLGVSKYQTQIKFFDSDIGVIIRFNWSDRILRWSEVRSGIILWKDSEQRTHAG